MSTAIRGSIRFNYFHTISLPLQSFFFLNTGRLRIRHACYCQSSWSSFCRIDLYVSFCRIDLCVKLPFMFSLCFHLFLSLFLNLIHVKLLGLPLLSSLSPSSNHSIHLSKSSLKGLTGWRWISVCLSLPYI